jgi:DNA replication protein DnaC
MKKLPYEECKTCIATPFCKKYSGEYEANASMLRCNSKFRLEKALKLSNIPEQYINANIYNYNVDKENMSAFRDLQEIVEDIVSKIDNGTNFVIIGAQTGTGKTYSASVILNHYIYKTCLTSRMDFENPLAYFISFPELINELRYYREEERVEMLLHKVRNVPVLLLDDVGAGTLTDFAREQAYLIINHRISRKLSTIITSNYSLDKLQSSEFLGSRIVSRLVERGIGIELNGRDRRLEL